MNLKSPLTWFTALAFLILGAVCAFWMIQLFTPLPAAAPASQIAERNPQGDAENVSRLFGAAPSAETAPNPPLDSGPLSIVGAIGSKSQGAVLVNVSDATSKVVRVGDEVSPGLTVNAIEADFVEFRRGTESLRTRIPRNRPPN